MGIERLKPQVAKIIPYNMRMLMTNAYRLLALPLAATLALAAFGAVSPAVAFADDEGPDITTAEPSELQQRVEESAAAYNKAVDEVEDLQKRIDENGDRIKEIEAQLPEQQRKTAAACISMYKLSENSTGVTDVLMGAQSLDELISALDYLESLANSNLEQIAKLQDMQSDLSDTQAQLLAEKAQAEKAVAKAEAALAEATAAREEAAAAAAAAVTQAEMDAMREVVAEEAAAEALADAEEQGMSEEEAQAQAEAAAAKAASAVDENAVANGDVDWSMDKKAFVAEWSERIDNYLDGSPMEGQGSNFASAAWDYGVDPRWSPAIATTESTKGQYTFAEHNAWGWGSASWGSWEEAIDDHVKGLADGYGSTITQEGAEKYCPPNADHWYNTTLSEMNHI